MADVYLSLQRGQDGNPDRVVAGAASTATQDVEVRILLDNSINRAEAIRLMQTIEMWIQQGGFKPSDGANLPVN